MSYSERPLNLWDLKQLIKQGVNKIQPDLTCENAVLVIGDTGVGKSTIINFLSGEELIIKYDGLKPTLDSIGSSSAKIGHDKLSQTTLPTKVKIQNMSFFDCPGFKDNKSEEQDIANSFYIQRLLDLYPHMKIVLVVDESHISQARADKLPKLLKNLLAAFNTFEDIKEGVCMIVNRAGSDNYQEDYHEEILRMIELQNDGEYLFEYEEQMLLRFLVLQNKILLFKQAPKNGMSKSFIAETENNILACIKQLNFVRSKKINNIISENAKLSIRDFIDETVQKSNRKIQTVCAEIIKNYKNRSDRVGKNIHGILEMKADVVKLAEETKVAEKQNIVELLQRQIPRSKMQDFEQDFASIMFFKGIYDKTATYFSNLINKIYSQLSYLLTLLDKKITLIQKQEEEQQKRQQARLEQKMKEEKIKQERLQLEKKEQERIQKERQEKIKQENQKRQRERLEKIKLEEERIQREKQERIQKEKQRIRIQQERIANQEKQRVKREEERREYERQEKIKLEKMRMEEEKLKQIQTQKQAERLQLLRKQNERKQIQRRQEERIQKQKQEKQEKQKIQRQKRQQQLKLEKKRQQELKKQEQQRIIEERKRIEEIKRIEEQKRIQQQKRIEQQKKIEQQRKMEEQRKIEQQRRIEQQKRVEEQRRIDEQRRIEEQRMIEEERRIEEQRRMEEQRRIEQRRIEEQRRAQEKKKLEQQKKAAQARREGEIFERRTKERKKWHQLKDQIMTKIKVAVKELNVLEQDLKRVKDDAISLQSFNRKIQNDCIRVEQTYFKKVQRI